MKSKMLICALVIGAFALGSVNQSPSQKKDDPPKKVVGNDELAKLGKARLEAAEKAYKAWFKDTLNERPISTNVYQLSVRWLQAELDLADGKEKRSAAYTRHFEHMKEWKKRWSVLADDGSRSFLLLDSFEKEAEYWLARERVE